MCYYCPTFTEIGVFRHILVHVLNVQFHENLSGGSRVVSCGLTDGRTHMPMLVVAAHHANALKINRKLI